MRGRSPRKKKGEERKVRIQQEAARTNSFELRSRDEQQLGERKREAKRDKNKNEKDLIVWVISQRILWDHILLAVVRIAVRPE